jgi:antitoxin VapB
VNIASARIDELAQRLARLTGENVETAIERAVEERLSRVETATQADRRAALQKFIDRVARMPIKDTRPIDDIIGYGPDGLPSA